MNINKKSNNVSNIVVSEKSETKSIEATIIKQRLRCTRHVFRMNRDRLTLQILYNSRNCLKRSQLCVIIRISRKRANISRENWEELEANRPPLTSNLSWLPKIIFGQMQLGSAPTFNADDRTFYSCFNSKSNRFDKMAADLKEKKWLTICFSLGQGLACKF